MEQEKIAQIRAHSAQIYRRSRDWVVGLSATVRVMLGLFLFAALLMALHTGLSAKNASLRVTVQHGFRSGDISMWIDGDLAYSGKLAGATKKKFGLIAGSVQGNFTEILPVPAGVHQIRVQVRSESGSALQNTVAADFAENTERRLSVSTRPGNLSLVWQGIAVAAPSSGSNGFTRYASAIFLTVGGSIVSALTGFALRELPAHLRARQEAGIKAQSTAAGE
jgi:hypothetical protein